MPAKSQESFERKMLKLERHIFRLEQQIAELKRKHQLEIIELTNKWEKENNNLKSENTKLKAQLEEESNSIKISSKAMGILARMRKESIKHDTNIVQ